LKPATLAKVVARARRSGLGEWLWKRVPALQGPHAARPWVKQLRQLIDPHPTLA
ncbi:MAG: ISLre2 family transposase, partial [Chloroflexota bacterium]